MEAKHTRQARTSTTHAQVWARHVQAGALHAAREARAWHSQARTVKGHSWPFAFLIAHTSSEDRIAWFLAGLHASRCTVLLVHREPMVAHWAAHHLSQT